ncbi:MAG TPA: class I SAM-dependent methyltransferase [Vicinamibacterales bacterium]|nr:class I SAM-dependent methyltransferase [Vicinamibacterales bacterium]
MTRVRTFRLGARAALALAAIVLLAGEPGAGAAGQNQQRHGRLFPPEDLGLLESPDRDVWQKPERIMDSLGIADGSRVADVGAGGGWFTIRLARRVGPNGIVFAQDVQPQMLEAIERRVAKENLRNVQTIRGTPTDPMLPAGALDAVLIVEAFHEIQTGNPRLFLQNVKRGLKDGGRVGVVDYKEGGAGPGPDDGARPDPAAVEAVAREAGLRLVKRETFLPFQFFLVFAK